jgi:hypothetical protein
VRMIQNLLAISAGCFGALFPLGLVVHYLFIFNMISTRSLGPRLLQSLRYSTINWTSGNPYNLRWQYKWKHAYYTYPRDGHEPTHVKKP